MSGNDGAMPDMAYCIQMPTPGDQQGKCRSPDVADYGGIRVLWLVKQEGICHPFRNVNSRQSSSELQRFLYLFVTYIMFVHVGKGLPTYCVTRAVGRQPLAANDKQSNQRTLETLYIYVQTHQE